MKVDRPRCPACRSEDVMVLLPGGTQAFCKNEACRIFMFDPTKTMDELLDEGLHYIDLTRDERADD